MRATRKRQHKQLMTTSLCSSPSVADVTGHLCVIRVAPARAPSSPMYNHAPLLLSLAMLALFGGLPHLLERNAGVAECPGPGGDWDQGTSSGTCDLAFLSHNPLILHCPGASEAEEGTVHWQYLKLNQSSRSQPHTIAGPRGLRTVRGPLGSLGGRATMRGGVLLLSRAWSSDSGLYLCKAGAATLAAYRVDVQDSTLLHVSHRALGQAPLGNQSVQLTSGLSTLHLHTQWAPWQDCDRCGAAGERKRLGFCYAQLVGVSDEDEAEEDEETEALPCGLMQLRLGEALPRRGPELRYETCRRACTENLSLGLPWATDAGPSFTTSLYWLEPRTLLLETMLLEPHEEARMTCPGASVYTPVSWQRDAAPLTRHELLHPCKGSRHRLDDATGGGVYRIVSVRASDSGIYRCWVRGRRVAVFHLELPEPLAVGSSRRRYTRQLIAIVRALIGSFILAFTVGALAELLHACWCGMM